MNIINLPAREAAERELVILTAELHDRALIGGALENAAVVASLARRVAATAEMLSRNP
ncbi:MAG: hypothetical protein V4712_08380 [Pseudomonadota bacterium]